jgi:5-methyltetrahydrofolate--homocysteine methyltransferase
MNVLAALRLGRILVADGACGTELLKLGLRGDECPELWCVSHPDAVRGIANAYLSAGADLVETNSFGANRYRLGTYGFGEMATELNETASRLGREALDAASAHGFEGWILGSMGPSGLRWGEASPEGLAAAFALQAEALARGGVDALCIETMMDAREAAIAVGAAKSATGLEAICCYSFILGPDGGARTIAGQGLREAASAALDSGADILGANCGRGFDEMLLVLPQLMSALRELKSGAPIMVSPNAGLPTPGGAYPGTPAAMESFARTAIAGGASIVGGCCGTGPEHVRAIRRAVDAIDRSAAEALL